MEVHGKRMDDQDTENIRDKEQVETDTMSEAKAVSVEEHITEGTAENNISGIMSETHVTEHVTEGTADNNISGIMSETHVTEHVTEGTADNNISGIMSETHVEEHITEGTAENNISGIMSETHVEEHITEGTAENNISGIMSETHVEEHITEGTAENNISGIMSETHVAEHVTEGTADNSISGIMSETHVTEHVTGGTADNSISGVMTETHVAEHVTEGTADNSISGVMTETHLTVPNTEVSNDNTDPRCSETVGGSSFGQTFSSDTKEDTASDTTGKASIFCDPCASDGEKFPAEGYCVDCGEYLCETCYKMHCRPSVTRHHQLQNIENIERRNSICATDYCKEHLGQVILYFCKSHEEFCCCSCRDEKHVNCKNMKSLSNLLDGYCRSGEVDKAIKSIESVSINAERIKGQIRASGYVVEFFQQKALTKIADWRSEINAELDTLEADMCTKVNDRRNEDSKKLTNLNKKVEAILFDMENLKSCIYSLRTSQKNAYRLLVLVKKTSQRIRQCKDELEIVTNSNVVDRYTFETQCNVKITAGPNELKAVKQEKVIEEWKQLTVKSDNDINISKTVGMVALRGNLLVCSDENNKALKLVDTLKNTVLNTTTFTTTPGDITKIHGRSVAVLLAEEQKITFCDILKDKELKKVKEIQTRDKFSSIVCIREKKTLAALSEKDVQFIDMEGSVITKVDLKIHDCNMRNSKLILNDNRSAMIILQRSEKLLVFDFQGNQRGSIYIDVQGLTIDTTGTVYMYTCPKRWSQSSFTIHYLRESELLSWRPYWGYERNQSERSKYADGKPSSILYSDEGGFLLIATGNTVCVYRVA